MSACPFGACCRSVISVQKESGGRNNFPTRGVCCMCVCVCVCVSSLQAICELSRVRAPENLINLVVVGTGGNVPECFRPNLASSANRGLRFGRRFEPTGLEFSVLCCRSQNELPVHTNLNFNFLISAQADLVHSHILFLSLSFSRARVHSLITSLDVMLTVLCLIASVPITLARLVSLARERKNERTNARSFSG